MSEIDRAWLRELMSRELASFREENPRSFEIFERARGSLLDGVPMNWMVRWPGEFPVYVDEAHGARFTDVDGHEYVDLCLGDTGAMAGHSPEPVVRTVSERSAKGITTMLPNEDAGWVGEELSRRFGLPLWQFSLTATDANRWAIRLCRQITGRPKILVQNWCYHGSVDETFIQLGEDGKTVLPREGNIGPPVDPAETTRVVEINDVEALERELAHGDVACVLVEPALTNIGIVLPDEGFHDAMRALTREHGALLIIDETHTICAGPGGYTKAYGLDPDVLTIGKTIGGGIPIGTYGFTHEVAEGISNSIEDELSDVGGVGGTLAGNALSLAAARACLGEVLTDEAFERMIALGERFTEGVQSVIDEHGAPWHVTRLGCRAEFLFSPEVARDGAQAAASGDAELDRYMHLHALNRGILLTPFHNMSLMSPATAAEDVDRHTEVFRDGVGELVRGPA